MTEPLRLPAEGSCRCGALRFQVTAPPLFTAVCHCSGCQKTSGGYSVLVASFPETGFERLAGTPVQGGLKNPALRHMHCADCLCPVYTEGEMLQGRVNIRLSLFDQTDWFIPLMDLWMSEALPGDHAASANAFDGWPPKDALPELTAAFQAQLEVVKTPEGG